MYYTSEEMVAFENDHMVISKELNGDQTKYVLKHYKPKEEIHFKNRVYRYYKAYGLVDILDSSDGFPIWYVLAYQTTDKRKIYELRRP